MWALRLSELVEAGRTEWEDDEEEGCGVMFTPMLASVSEPLPAVSSFRRLACLGNLKNSCVISLKFPDRVARIGN